MTDVLELKELTFRIPGFTLGPISFTLEQGKILSIVGPNGSGKTTLLRIVAGLEPATSGDVRLRGSSAGNVPVERRGLGFVFQDLALFPHMTVEENIDYGLWVQKWSDRGRAERVASLARDFGLVHILRKRPGELSGGERQRVAVARALAPRPSLLLLDEPLSSVDPENRRNFLADLKLRLTEDHVTALHVTHDIDEGSFLSDEMAVLWAGQMAQFGPTPDVLRHPRSEKVARFLGFNVWRDGESTLAALPSSFTLDLSSPGPTYQGTVRMFGRSLQGNLLDVQLGGSGPLIRIELDRRDPIFETLKMGKAITVRCKESIPVAPDMEGSSPTPGA